MHKNTSSSREPDGTLDQTSVPALLAHAWHDKRSGCLVVSAGEVKRRFQVQKGSPISIETERGDDDFAQTLEDEGHIRPADRMKAERYARDKNTSQASAILALRLLDAKILLGVLRKATRNHIAETFEWQTGEYQWIPAAKEDTATAKPLDILSLIQEQLPRRWGSDRLFQSLMNHSSSYAEIAPHFRLVAAKLAKAGGPASETIGRLDGNVSIGQILGECAGNPDAAATLWTLIEASILRLSSAKKDSDDASQTTTFQFEIESTAPRLDRTRQTSPSATHASAKTNAGVGSESLRVEIATLIEALADLDHYTALGLTVTATPTEIKRAYFKAAKKFHPDALTRLGLKDLSDDAGRVFARIAEAFETLSDEGKKAAYDAGGSDEPEIDTARLAQAETSFRKGEILVKMGNFGGALEYLAPAVALWPDEPAYQAELGWALYKQPRSDAARAREHLELAIAASPDEALALYRLGVVLRALGETQAGEASIARAHALDPSIDE